MYGALQAQQLYGTAEASHHSIPRDILRNPGAFSVPLHFRIVRVILVPLFAFPSQASIPKVEPATSPISNQIW